MQLYSNSKKEFLYIISTESGSEDIIELIDLAIMLYTVMQHDNACDNMN